MKINIKLKVAICSARFTGNVLPFYKEALLKEITLK